jgi:DNA primase
MDRDALGRTPDDVVEQVRAATDIVQLVGQYVNLKRAGRSFKGLCPFHSEKTPSFMVNPERGMYHCFGCHKGGDAFSFLMEHDGVSFVEALRTLGERAGIEVTAKRPRDGAHDALYAATERAARFYTEMLSKPAGRDVRAYLERRGISAAVAEHFRLGAAPNAWEELGRALRVEDCSEDTLLALGLVARRTATAGTYDVFRNRLMIPVVSLSGRVVGFGGRVLPGAETDRGGPKYLNTPDSPIYHKGQLLYGLGEARAAIRRQDAVVLTEGYLDFLTLYQAGIEHVVAACGTAFTPQQAALLHRYTRRAYILGDSDPAGRRAAVRTAGLLLEHGFLVYLVELPSGFDPDSFVREHGAQALETRLREAPSYIAFMKLLVDRRAGDMAVKERVVRHLLEDLQRVSDPLLQELYGEELSRTFGLSPATLAAARDRQRRTGDRPGAGRATAALAAAEPRRTALEEARHGLLRLGLLGAPWPGRLATELEPEDFEPGPGRRLFEVLCDPAAGAAAADGWFDRLEAEEDRSYATRLALEEAPAGEPERLFADYVAAVRRARLEAAQNEIMQEIAAAQARGDQETANRLAAEQNAVARDRSAWTKRAPGN